MTNRRESRIALLDINVLVALCWPNHVHHGTATAWFARRPTKHSWATTPITESGLVRISSNRKALPTAVSPNEALAVLTTIRAIPGHVFLADDVENVFGETTAVEPSSIATHRQITDAHLLAIAARHRATLVTFDRGIRPLALDPDLVEILP